MFDPASGSKYGKDDDHIAQIIELMGEIPQSIALSGQYSIEFFNRKGTVLPYPLPHNPLTPAPIGELRHINKLRYWSLDAVLREKYLFPKADADAITSFLTPMLRLHPDERAKASELIHHSWLDGVVVQGEIDVIRRAEEEELAADGDAGGAGEGVGMMESAPMRAVVVPEAGEKTKSTVSPDSSDNSGVNNSPGDAVGPSSRFDSLLRQSSVPQHWAVTKTSGTPHNDGLDSDDSSNSNESRHSAASFHSPSRRSFSVSSHHSAPSPS